MKEERKGGNKEPVHHGVYSLFYLVGQKMLLLLELWHSVKETLHLLPMAHKVFFQFLLLLKEAIQNLQVSAAFWGFCLVFEIFQPFLHIIYSAQETQGLEPEERNQTLPGS